MQRTRCWMAVCVLALLLAAGGLVAAFTGSTRASMSAGSTEAAHRVVIDPGHGDFDPGAVGVGGVVEKTIVLEIAHLVYLKSLAHPSLDVTLTRRNDVFLTLEERIAMANRLQADVYVSIHANFYSDADVSGIETMIDKSATWGGSCDLLAAILQEHLVKRTGSVDRGVKHASLYLWRADMPAALVEVGFLTNPAEAARLQQLSYQDAVAEAILEGILAFLDEG